VLSPYFLFLNRGKTYNPASDSHLKVIIEINDPVGVVAVANSSSRFRDHGLVFYSSPSTAYCSVYMSYADGSPQWYAVLLSNFNIRI
jgi:hypothetical protein